MRQVFVPPQPLGSLQGTIGQIVITAYMIITLWAMPFERKSDNFLQLSSLVGERLPGVAHCALPPWTAHPHDCTLRPPAVLWLLLLSGCAAKWADLNPGGQKGLAAMQLFLSSFVALLCVALVVIGLPYVEPRLKVRILPPAVHFCHA